MALSQQQSKLTLANTLYFPRIPISIFLDTYAIYGAYFGTSRGDMVTVRYSFSKKSHAGETKLGVGKIKGLIRTENQSLPPAEEE
ncbi:unnamed protein product [Rangifer tarandus platyrhynchus]|uniref:Uncharacterized protein n=2 Tax=Rangifer tarandus platyrhynchus TaxID=3082113 RepID=A0ABN8YV44_RANTA|nr:unnamed protein product [Rangifer tarandus platyrhynchus]CAI9701722.1 unnamed protein product [Rangifer tarandus platyrhynchus]